MNIDRRILAAATTLAALAAPAPALADWSAPHPISQPGAFTAGEVDIAFDADGDAVAAWTQFVSGGNSELFVATRPAGGAWSAPQNLAPDHPDYSGDDAFAPSVVVHASGRAIVSWEENTAKIPSRTNVVAAVGRAGEAGSFGPAVTLHDPNVNGGGSEPVFDGEGVAHIVYDAGRVADNRLYERTLAPGATTWSVAEPVAPAMSVPQYDVDLAVDAQGNAAVAWTSDYFSDTDVPDVNAAVRPAGGTWSAPTQLELDAASSAPPRVTIDPAGRALVAWGSVRLASRPAGDPLATWDDKGEVITGEDLVDMQVGDDGVAHLLTRANAELRHRTLAAESTVLSDHTTVDPADSGYEHEPRLAVGPGGEVAVSWSNGSQPALVALGDAEGWNAAVAITPEELLAHQGASVAWDNRGSVVAGLARQRELNGPLGADLVVLDRTAPDLLEASFQTTGHAGQPFEFTAAGTDDWSPVTYEWAFGDGATATGPSVSHTYATAGTRQVALRLVSAGGVSEIPPLDVEVGEPLTHEEPVHEQPVQEQPPTTPPAVAPPVTHTPPPAGPTVTEIVKVLGTFPKAPVTTPKEAVFEQSFPSAGKAKWDLYLGRPAATKARAAAAKKPVLLGTATRAIAGAGKVKAKIKVARKRQGALRRAKRPQVFLRTTFTDVAGRTVSTVRAVKFKKR